MSFKPMVQTFGDPKFYGNNLAFATREEAEFSAKDLARRWLMVENWRVDESDEPVNYQIDLVTRVMTPVQPNPQPLEQPA